MSGRERDAAGDRLGFAAAGGPSGAALDSARRARAEPPGDRIELRAMCFAGRHGVLAEERDHPQPFEVDIVLELDLAAAGGSDVLSDTVDYGRVFEAARAVVEGPHLELLESLAGHIASAALEVAREASAVTVRVRKLKAPLPGRLAWAGVEIRRSRA